MFQGGVAVYTGNDWHFCHCRVYNNNQWKMAYPYVYTNSAWNKSGGAGVNMIQFVTSDGKDLLTSDGKNFLVREQ